jgi:act minimal PKS acyl carrier protein
MSAITLQDLSAALAESAGADEGDALGDTSLDLSFTELGYDSLALLETAALVQERHGARLDDDEITTLRTPREFLDLANRALARTA